MQPVMHRKTAYICYFMGLFACGFETRGYAPHGSCATHHASPLACVLWRTAYRQKFPISFAQRACFLDFCRNTVSPPRQLSPYEITQTFATFCLCLTGCIFYYKLLLQSSLRKITSNNPFFSSELSMTSSLKLIRVPHSGQNLVLARTLCPQLVQRMKAFISMRRCS